MFDFLHISDTSTTLSGTLGAKQLVVVKIHRIYSGPKDYIYSSIDWMFVVTISPSVIFSITMGIRLAV